MSSMGSGAGMVSAGVSASRGKSGAGGPDATIQIPAPTGDHQADREAVDPIPGRRLGDFIVGKKIGQGGVGEVYEAEQALLQRKAVIKVLYPERRTNPADIERFLLEARLASQLDHPYAAHIYAYGVESDRIRWIAMELVRGVTLYELLEEQGPLAPERLIPLVERIAEVVHSAHERGIIHRDIKPANVMVIARAGRLLPKLLDFGIAKLSLDAAAAPPESALGPHGSRPIATIAHPEANSTGQTTEPITRGSWLSASTGVGATMGSPTYMSPEQWIDSARVDARTDIYALGVLTFQTLTGRPPFRAARAELLREAHLHQPVPSLGAGFPPALDAVLRRAMAKQPGDRYDTALSFAAALRDAAGLASAPRPLPKLAPAVADRWVQSGPAPLAECVAALSAAQDAGQALELVGQVVEVAARTVGLVALAGRARIGRRRDDAAEVAGLVRDLRRGGLTARSWLELARALTRPFERRSELHPVPELPRLFFPEDGGAALLDAESTDRLLRLESGQAARADRSERLQSGLTDLAALLSSLSFLLDYPLVAARAGGPVESWMGRQRSPRAPAPWRGGERPPADQPHLTDAEGVPVLSLWPLFQVAEPAPGGDREIFLFKGPSPRAAALLSAMPLGFEREDDAIWSWLVEWIWDGDPTTEDTAGERAPYRGLFDFRPEDAAFFFGRERESQSFRNRLRVQSLLVVVGPSGAGKSSFVKAGIVPALPPSWTVVTIRPGAAPIAALAAALGAHDERDPYRRAGQTIDAGIDELVAGDGDPAEIARRLRRAAAAEQRTLLLVVDQCEELFTLCQSPAEQTRFAEILAAAAASPADPVRVILTLRDDFLARAEQLAPFRHRLGQGLQLLTTPGPDELRRIIREPALRSGYTFDDPSMVDEMVREVEDRPGALPLIAFAMGELWQLRDHHYKQLTRSAYESLGGVVGALADYAERLLSSLPLEEQRLVREAFRALVTADGTRAVVMHTELTHALGRSARAERVIELLVNSRRLVASEGEGGERLEVVHEALLTAWPRLVAWREEDAGNAKLRDQLRSASQQWHERGRPRGLLWRDDALAEYKVWRARYPGGLTDLEDAFARASLRQAVRGRRWKQFALTAAFAVLGAGALVLFRMNSQSHQRLVRLYTEQGRLAVVAGDPMRGLVYLGEAFRAGARGPALDLLLGTATHALGGEIRSIYEAGRSVGMPEFSPDGRRILTSGDDDRAEIWDAASGELLATLTGTGSRGWIEQSAWSPDGRYVALRRTGGLDVGVWDTDTGHLLHTLSAHTAELRVILPSPDSRRVLTAGYDGTARIWDLETGSLRRVLTTTDQIISADWSPDSRRVALGVGDGTVQLWDASTGLRLTVQKGHTQPVHSLRFSPDGKWIATSSWDSTGRIWDAATGTPLFVLPHDRPVDTVVFSPDGTRVVTSSQDRTAKVWDVATGALVQTLEGHAGPVFIAQVSRDGTRILTTGGDETARLWDARTGEQLWTYVGALWSATFDPAGQRVLARTIDGNTRIWDARKSVYRLSLQHGDRVGSARYSPDGTRILTAGDRTIRLWDAETGRQLAATPPQAAALSFVTWSPDGTRFLSFEDKIAKIWDVRTMRPIVRLVGHTGTIWGAGRGGFSPDGTRVVTGGADRTARIWDARTGQELLRLTGHRGDVNGAEFSPDGTRVATASEDHTARIWDAQTGKLLRELKGHPEVLVSATFDHTGDRLLTTSGDRTARIWDAHTGKVLAVLQGHTHQVNRSDFHPDGTLVVTSSIDGTARLWDAHDGRLLANIHQPWLGEATFSPDGTHILTASRNGTAKIWDLPIEHTTPESIARFIHCRVPFGIEGDHLAAAKTDPGLCREEAKIAER